MKTTTITAARRILIGMLAILLLAAPARATSVVPPSLRLLANESDYVIRAVVTSVHSEYRDSARGRKIVTKVTLDVRDVIAGQPPATVVLEMLGGTVDGRTLTVEGAPRFKVGDEDVLFVKNNGRAIHPLLALMHGRYPILRDAQSGREYVALSNHLPLTDVAQINQPLAAGAAAELQRRLGSPAEALSPAQFRQLILSARETGYTRERLN